MSSSIGITQEMDDGSMKPGSSNWFSPLHPQLGIVTLLPPLQSLLPGCPLPKPLPDDLSVDRGVGLPPGPDEGLHPRHDDVAVAAPLPGGQAVEWGLVLRPELRSLPGLEHHNISHSYILTLLHTWLVKQTGQWRSEISAKGTNSLGGKTPWAFLAFRCVFMDPFRAWKPPSLNSSVSLCI